MKYYYVSAIARNVLIIAALLSGFSISSRAQDGTFHLIVPEQSLRNAIFGVGYFQPIRIVAAHGEIEVEPIGPFPPGMFLEPTGDRHGTSLAGTPILPGVFSFGLTVVDAEGRAATGIISLQVVTLPLELLDDPGGDLDGDGIQNLAERGMGRSPFEKEPFPPMEVERVGGAPVFRSILDPSVTELHRAVQVWNPHFTSWKDSAIDPPVGTTGLLVTPLNFDPDATDIALARMLFSVPTTKGDQLAEVIKKLNELAESVENAEGDLEDNPLVKEVRLIELILSILEQPGDVADLLKEWLEGALDDLYPPLDDLSDDDYNALVDRINANLDRIKDTLCYAKSLLDFLAKVEQNPTEKARIEAAADQIERVKNLLENAQDLDSVYDELRRGLEGLQDLLADKVEEIVKEQLEEFIRKQLVRRYGAGAASAIMSAAVDAFNLIDALIAQGRLEEARALYYLMLFRMFDLAYQCPKYHIDCERWNTSENDPRIQFAAGECPTGKKVTVQACIRCWQQTPDGAPNEGSFTEMPVEFEGGATTIEKNPFTSDYADECGYRFRLNMDDFKAKAANCPHAHLILKVRVNDGPVLKVFGGVFEH